MAHPPPRHHGPPSVSAARRNRGGACPPAPTGAAVADRPRDRAGAVCAAVAGALFQSSAKRGGVVAAKNLPTGTVLSPGDLATAQIPASGDITAMSAIGSPRWSVSTRHPGLRRSGDGRTDVSGAPQLAAGEQVVGMLLKGDQIVGAPRRR